MRRFAQRSGFTDFDALQRWSVTDLEGFWRALADFYDVQLDAERVLGARAMPGAEWFPGATLNYARHVLETGDGVAVVARPGGELTWEKLRERVAGVRAGLQA